MADIDLGDLLDDVELKVPTTQVERVEDARTTESAIRYFDGKMEEYEGKDEHHHASAYTLSMLV